MEHRENPTQAGEVILEVRDLHLEFHDHDRPEVAVEDFDLELHRGEMVVPAAAAEGLRQGCGVKNEINIYTQEMSQSILDYIYAAIVERAGDEL